VMPRLTDLLGGMVSMLTMPSGALTFRLIRTSA
jgi:hypothetical protein